MPLDARIAFARAQAWRDRPEAYALDRALEEVRRARALAPDAEGPLNLEAAILVDRGEMDAAVALFEESLDRDPSQTDVLVGLAPLYERMGRLDDAERMWQRAALLDHPAALWRRARVEADAGRPWATRRTLARYFETTAGGVEYEAAQRLDAAQATRIRATYVAGGALAVGLVAVPVWAIVRRRSGVGLDGLLESSPSSWRDVARILSAIRHEILRHHASSFAEVADALDTGDAEAGRWLAAQWYRDGAAMARFDTYVGELRELGRKAGVPLRLETSDPVLGPLLAAVRRFAALRTPLERGTRTRHVASELRAIAEVLDEQVSPALGRTVARLCLLEIDEALLGDIVETVWREPALWDEASWRPQVAPLPSGPLLVRMFRSDLVDVLANVLRNAVEATHGIAGPRVGIAVALDADPITGLERIEIRVRDTSPRQLSTSAVRGRFVGRGLGLAGDLTTRAGGSISVEDEPGWGKAVVVRLPRAEPIDP
jgi:signal transduction histidine kinase